MTRSYRPSFRDDKWAGIFSLAMVAGLFLDGWNHINLKEDRLGPFFTPWHGLLYLGFTAAVFWVLSRGQGERWSWRAVPEPYRVAVPGLAFSALGMFGDAAWHTLFGKEEGVARLIAPFHVTLLVGGFLVASCAFRSRWASPDDPKSLKEFAPALLSVVSATAMVAFFFQYLSPLVAWGPVGAGEAARVRGVSAVLLTSLIFLAPLVLVLRRWKPPFGSFAVMCAGVAALQASMTNFARAETVVAAAAGGLAADWAVRRYPAIKERAACVACPAVLWSSHFLFGRLVHGTTWDAEIWMGAVVLSCLGGYVLSVLAAPPALPKAEQHPDLEITTTVRRRKPPATPKPRTSVPQNSRKGSPRARRTPA